MDFIVFLDSTICSIASKLSQFRTFSDLTTTIVNDNQRIPGGYWTLMARPEAVGAALPRRTVARPPFWLAALVVTTGMARSGVFTDVSSCLPRSPSRVEYYHGKETGRDKLS